MIQTPPVRAPEAVGLTRAEYEEIIRRLGRDPSALELRLFGVMWSEHCGYKHSRLTLRSLPAESPRLLQGPGENAGVLDLGGGWAVAFKMESHNHPSAVDPYNGAATGVGGIVRDVLSMGARPIALLDSLRFGPLGDPGVRRVAAGVVAGIAGYGNCIGVPTVGGELLTDAAYRGNPLVNVACLGLVRTGRIARATASGAGNLVLYAGARTGRDGIGGAAFASAELDEHSARDHRPSVQIGDPFTGKLLIEATLEALAAGGVVALQDMGAAGLTCAASEMAARGGVGMRLDLDAAPSREPRMRPEEILLSESQERMLLVVRPEAAASIAGIYTRWGLQACVIGEITEEQRLVVAWRGAAVVDLPPYALADAPAFRPAAQEPETLRARWTVPVPTAPDPEAPEALLRLLAWPEIASKRAVFRQYDHSVQVRTVLGPGAGDAAVLRVTELAPRGLALAVAGSGRLCGLDPYRGARLAVAECTAALACVGAEPLGVTDCLNFGSPERPEIFWTFRQAVAGIADACRALRIPVVGGNVSFYNESPDGPVPPTPVVAMVGVVEDVGRSCGIGFRGPGELIFLVGDAAVDLAGSAYLQALRGVAAGRPRDVDLERHTRVTGFVREAARRGLPASTHDCAEGGLAVAIAECALAGACGVEAVIPDIPALQEGFPPQDGPEGGARSPFAARDHADPGRSPASVDRVPARTIAPSSAVALFGEGPSRFVLSASEDAADALCALAAKWDVPLILLGRTGGSRLRLRVSDAAAGHPATGRVVRSHLAGAPNPDTGPLGPAGGVWTIDLSLEALARAYDALSEVFA